jgi:hypothetical protein
MPYRMILAVLLLTSISAYGQDIPGRYLPDGHYLARNMQAALPDTPIYDPHWPVILDWGAEIYVSDTAHGCYDPRIVIGDTVLHVFGEGPLHFKSYDNGDTWQFWANYHDSTLGDLSIVNAYCEESNLYITYYGQRGNNPGFVIFRSSSDEGQTWPIIRELSLNPNRYTARHSNVSGHGDTAFVSFTEFYSFDSLSCWRTTNRGSTWTNRNFIADAWGESYEPSICYAAGVVHIAFQKDYNHQDAIFYMRSTDYGQSWSEPLMLDFDDGNHGQFPELWADSSGNVAVCWMDYTGSPYDWTGGIWCRISHDYGQTWLEPVMLNDDYLGWAGTSVVVDGAYLAVAWVANTTPQNTVHVIESTDAGESWQNDQAVAEGWSFAPRLAKKGNTLYLIWREIEFVRPDFSVDFIKFMRNDLSVGIHSFGEALEDKISMGLSVYPNPFNSSATIMLTGPKGGDREIRIYDIRGALVKSIDLGMEGQKATWDATDNSGQKVCSGLYFARASSSHSSQNIKLILLR